MEVWRRLSVEDLRVRARHGLHTPTQLTLHYSWVVVKIWVPFWVISPNIRCRTIMGTPKGTIILTTTQLEVKATTVCAVCATSCRVLMLFRGREWCRLLQAQRRFGCRITSCEPLALTKHAGFHHATLNQQLNRVTPCQ